MLNISQLLQDKSIMQQQNTQAQRALAKESNETKYKIKAKVNNFPSKTEMLKETGGLTNVIFRHLRCS
jgi:hypothetical protein